MDQTPSRDTDPPSPRDRDSAGDDEQAAAPVEVAVTRSGGFAGMTRRWSAVPPPAQAPEWMELIAQCPWDAAPAAPGRDDSPREPGAGADRFTWWIHVRLGEASEREAELPDQDLVGAWRELVDAVRAWNRAARR